VPDFVDETPFDDVGQGMRIQIQHVERQFLYTNLKLARLVGHTGAIQMKIRKIAGALGAELSEVDLNAINPRMAAEIRAALLENQVIFLRHQPLSPAQFLEFASHMGEPVEYPFVKGLEGFPHIIEVKKLEHERSNFGGIWHSDTTYLEEPPMGSMLLAREVPPYGGDTLFAWPTKPFPAP
jgi:taurine dioxygenase